MTPQELRTGNLVYLIDEIAEVQQVDKNGHIVLRRDGCIAEGEDLSSGHVQPIPITEGWLLELGFICVDEVNRGFTKVMNEHLKEKFYCSPVDGVCALVSELITYQDFILNNRRVKAVHELQNLWKEITGEELQIKEA